MNRTQPASGADAVPTLLEIAEAIHASRRSRATIFPKLASLMDGPCWDILLAVFIADQRNERMMVTATVSRTLAAKSTVMRQLEACYELGMIIRMSDVCDRRKIYLKLSEEATEAMQQYLEGVRDDPVLARKQLA